MSRTGAGTGLPRHGRSHRPLSLRGHGPFVSGCPSGRCSGESASVGSTRQVPARPGGHDAGSWNCHQDMGRMCGRQLGGPQHRDRRRPHLAGVAGSSIGFVVRSNDRFGQCHQGNAGILQRTSNGPTLNRVSPGCQTDQPIACRSSAVPSGFSDSVPESAIGPGNSFDSLTM